MNHIKSFNILNSSIIKEEFLNIFFNSLYFDLNSKFVLFENFSFPNKENSNLLYLNNHTNVIWYYYVSHNFNLKKNNFLLVCYNNNDFFFENEYKHKYEDIKLILNIFSEKINWEKEFLDNHLFKWTDQSVVADYLDVVCGGCVNFLPNSWGSFNSLNYNNDWQINSLKYYNVFLKNMNLKNNYKNKLNFITNYKNNLTFIKKFE